MRYPAFALAERLDHGLGDPHDPERPASFARCVALDTREEFPAQICAELDRLGLPRWYVPAEFGGELRDYEELLHAVRILARRDLTVAIGHGKTYLGAVSAWVGATPEQARRVGAEVLAGSVISLALTEREHGSDLLAGEVSAVPAGDGYRVDGEKWLINNASRGDLVCVLARTDPAGGTQGFSLLMVDKRRLAPGTFRCLPKEHTHGVRGADISGIAFTGAEVPADALVGTPGAGPEIVLKSVQLTRTMCAAMSLGLADQALRLVLDFATGHRLYDRPLVDLPHANRTLTEAYVDLLIGEATSMLTARGIHATPGELSVTSAVAKYLVPTMMDRTIPRLGQVLGARALLTADHADGLFQKIERDHRIVGIFDGNTLVNLNTLVNQFPGLVRGYRRGWSTRGSPTRSSWPGRCPTSTGAGWRCSPGPGAAWCSGCRSPSPRYWNWSTPASPRRPWPPRPRRWPGWSTGCTSGWPRTGRSPGRCRPRRSRWPASTRSPSPPPPACNCGCATGTGSPTARPPRSGRTPAGCAPACTG
ncbi:acyl-CoA dehydrogenase family protein [Plantactinospora veratri]